MKYNSIVSVIIAATVSIVAVWSGLAHRIGEMIGKETIWILTVLIPIIAIIIYALKATKPKKS
ncbi:MAG: hypothetical protein DRO40_10500 [Thermoprotei archaeon]|nr:MAG: hypothetical protein DRO40_10500 [Thermoprotei archaeon]